MVIKMEEYLKIFYLVKLRDEYKIVLESIYEKDDFFQDISKLVEKYSSEILKIVVNNSLKNNLETEFQLLVKKDKIDELLNFIKDLGYTELE